MSRQWEIPFIFSSTIANYSKGKAYISEVNKYII